MRAATRTSRAAGSCLACASARASSTLIIGCSGAARDAAVSSITAQFGRWNENIWNRLDTDKAACTGIGNNTMRIDNLTMKQVEGLKQGDWVTIGEDSDFPKLVHGQPFAVIETIRPIPSKPLFAEIIVKPRTDLRKLSEVLVMRK